jgi:RND family efflux transporter MFP subunit
VNENKGYFSGQLEMKKGALFKTGRVVIVLVMAMVIAAVLVTLKPEAERRVPVEKGQLVEVMPARAEKINMLIEAYGTVRPREALKIIAQVRGQIIDVDPTFEEGGFIRKGHLLIQIDPRDYQLEVERRQVQIQQVEAEIKRLHQEVRNLKIRIKIARSDTALANKEVVRLKRLVGKKVVAQSSVDRTEQKYLASFERLQGLKNQLALTGPQKEQLQAQLAMARVLLKEAHLALERTKVVAPFDGWVLEKTIEAGQHVNAGQYLGRIYYDGGLETEVNISVKDLKWFPAGLLDLTALKTDIIFDNDGDRYHWKGRVSRVKAQMEEKTRTLPVVVEIDESLDPAKNLNRQLLRPGIFVTVTIKGREVDNAYVLPRHVVHSGDVVYIVDAEYLKIKPVQVLRTFKDTVIISEGLEDGDLIVKSPLPSAMEGMRVRLKKGNS